MVFLLRTLGPGRAEGVVLKLGRTAYRDRGVPFRIAGRS
jgi:hypothetical protein